MPIRPLTTRIGPANGAKRAETDPDLNPGWHQFIVDHADVIRARSEIRAIQPTVFVWASYDLKRWMRAERIPLSMEWIIRIVNRNLSDLDFRNLSTIYLPEEGFIKTLFGQYRSNVKPRPLN